MNDTLCAFLRGINTGGAQIKMSELTNAFADMGFPEAKTVLATGNVLISAPPNADRDALKERIENALSKAFHYNAHILLRSTRELEAIIREADSLPLPPDCHLYVILCETPLVAGELAELFPTLRHSEQEQLKPLSSELLWIVKKGDTLTSEFGSKVLGGKQYKEKATTRNLNTVRKLLL